MASEQKRKKDIEKLLNVLTKEQREFLSTLDSGERANALEFFETLTDAERDYLASHDPKKREKYWDFFLRYSHDKIKILLEYAQRKEITEEERTFVHNVWSFEKSKYDIDIYEIAPAFYDIALNLDPELLKIGSEIDSLFYDIASKLTIDEIAILSYAAAKYPDSFIYEPAPPPTPEPTISVPPEVIVKCIPEKPEEMKRYPWKWRTQFPFQTSTFIQQFLTMRGSKGAYPYEVYKAYKISLWKMITDPKYREKIVEDKGIKFDGEMIDGELTKQIGRDVIGVIRACPGVHIATYTNFWKYFMVLNFLELVKKKGKRIKSDKSIFDKQLYILNKKIEKSNPKLWEIGWIRPQEMAYPLAGLGKRRYDKLKEDAKKHEVTIQEAFTREDIGYPEILDEVAEIRGVDRDELTEWVINSKYFKKG